MSTPTADTACGELAWTGSQLPLAVLIIIALLMMAAGAVLLSRRRARTGALVVVLLLACATGTLALAPAHGAQAACLPQPHAAANSLTIAQTSTNSGLTPTAAPSTLAGTVTNNGTDATYVATITATLRSVTKAPTAAPGACGLQDYALLHPRMPVQRHLAEHGGTVAFAGAQIRLLNASTNQDPCQGATLRILYTAN